MNNNNLLKNKRILWITIIVVLIVVGFILFKNSKNDNEDIYLNYQYQNGIFYPENINIKFNEKNNIISVKSDVQDIKYDYIYENDVIKSIHYFGKFNGLDIDSNVLFTYEDNKIKELNIQISGYVNATEKYVYYYNENDELIVVNNSSNFNNNTGNGRCYIYNYNDYILEECDKTKSSKTEITVNTYSKRIYKKESNVNFIFKKYKILPFIEYLFEINNYYNDSYINLNYENEYITTPMYFGNLIYEEKIRDSFENEKDEVNKIRNYFNDEGKLLKSINDNNYESYFKYEDDKIINIIFDKQLKEYKKITKNMNYRSDLIIGYKEIKEVLDINAYTTEKNNFIDEMKDILDNQREIDNIINSWDSIIKEKYKGQYISEPTIFTDLVNKETKNETLEFIFDVSNKYDYIPEIEIDKNNYYNEFFKDYSLIKVSNDVKVLLNGDDVIDLCSLDDGIYKCYLTLKKGENKIRINATNNYGYSNFEERIIKFVPDTPKIVLTKDTIVVEPIYDGKVLDSEQLEIKSSDFIENYNILMYFDDELLYDDYSFKTECSLKNDKTYSCTLLKLESWGLVHSGIHKGKLVITDKYNQKINIEFKINYK